MNLSYSWLIARCDMQDTQNTIIQLQGDCTGRLVSPNNWSLTHTAIPLSPINKGLQIILNTDRLPAHCKHSSLITATQLQRVSQLSWLPTCILDIFLYISKSGSQNVIFAVKLWLTVTMSLFVEEFLFQIMRFWLYFKLILVVLRLVQFG